MLLVLLMLVFLMRHFCCPWSLDVCLGNSVNQTVKATQVTECEAVTADEKEKEELLKLFEVFPGEPSCFQEEKGIIRYI